MRRVIGILVGLLFLSCEDKTEVLLVRDVKNQWAKNTAQKFDFEIKEPQNPRALTLIIRNNNEYPYSNLFLLAELSKDGKPVGKADTLSYRLANPDGTWLGSGFGQTKETWGYYKENYQFPSAGRYTLSIKQGMRTDTLKGIEDIGIKIEIQK